ncbi:MAG TPA: transketolase C-terminal domain-containing protein [Sphaerochaeta sp.]|nr:transketolase C-terminal domain-containing protein [Sphaerochaeta sp.]
MSEKRATRHGFYDGLVALARDHEDVYAVDADLGSATGSSIFQKAFPERYIDVGIAEQNLVGISVGLARVGIVPFCSSMAVFVVGRGFEIIRNAVAYSRINVKIIGSHTGITAASDGGSHQAIADLAAMRALPNMVVLSPCDYNQAKKMASVMYSHEGPVYLRTSREPVENVTSEEDEITLGRAQKLRSGKDVCIIATGMMTVLAVRASQILESEGIDATIINIHTIKPLDTESIREEVIACKGRVVVCEEANMFGGLSEAVASSLVEENDIVFAQVAIEDRFGQSGATATILEEYGVTPEAIAQKARRVVHH